MFNKIKEWFGMEYDVFNKRYFFDEVIFVPLQIKRTDLGEWSIKRDSNYTWEELYDYFRYHINYELELAQCLKLWNLPVSYEMEIINIWRTAKKDREVRKNDEIVLVNKKLEIVQKKIKELNKFYP